MNVQKLQTMLLLTALVSNNTSYPLITVSIHPSLIIDLIDYIENVIIGSDDDN